MKWILVSLVRDLRTDKMKKKIQSGKPDGENETTDIPFETARK